MNNENSRLYSDDESVDGTPPLKKARYHGKGVGKHSRPVDDDLGNDDNKLSTTEEYSLNVSSSSNDSAAGDASLGNNPSNNKHADISSSVSNCGQSNECILISDSDGDDDLTEPSRHDIALENDLTFIVSLFSDVDQSVVRVRLAQLLCANRTELIIDEILEGNLLKAVDDCKTTIPASGCSNNDKPALLEKVSISADCSFIPRIKCEDTGTAYDVKDEKSVLNEDNGSKPETIDMNIHEPFATGEFQRDISANSHDVYDGLDNNYIDLMQATSSADARACDVLLEDTMSISIMLPHVDRNTIYNYLDIHRDKHDRVQVVMNELLQTFSSQDIPNLAVLVNPQNECGAKAVDAPACSKETSEYDPLKNGEYTRRLMRDIQIVLSIIPTGNPARIKTILEDVCRDTYRVVICISQLKGNGPIDINKNNRPKIEEFLNFITERFDKKFAQKSGAPDSSKINKNTEIKHNNESQKNLPTCKEISSSKTQNEPVQLSDNNNCNIDDPVYQDALTIVEMFPDWEVNEICALVNSYGHINNRLQMVISDILSGNSKPASSLPQYSADQSKDVFDKNQAKTSEVSRAIFQTTPVMPGPINDGNTQVRVSSGSVIQTPGTSNEVLEMPNSFATAIQTISTTLQQIADKCVDTLQQIPNTSTVIPSTSTVIPISSTSTADATNNYDDEETDCLADDVAKLCNMFPDCDPNFIRKRLCENAANKDRDQLVATELLNKTDYPKLGDVLKKQEEQMNRFNVLNMQFNMDEFLSKFPDPLSVFYDETKAVSCNYMTNAHIEVLNRFPYFREYYIFKALKCHTNHLAPTIRELKEKNQSQYEIPGKTGQSFRRQFPHCRISLRSKQKFPMDNLDEYFFHERLFTYYEDDIREHLESKENARTAAMDLARLNGELLECSCCCDDECLITDMSSCCDGHIFCNGCVRKSTEVRIGEGKTKYPCLHDGCEVEFPITVLQNVLTSKLFSTLLCGIQEEQLRQADIPDIVHCPFCPFATVMPDVNYTVLTCLNPDCLKETCRLCKEENHIPLRCEEVESKSDCSKRKYIEDAMTDAMLRSCHRCKKKFYKVDGCNKMTCSCGATMCYICRQPNIDYNHFHNSKTCALWQDSSKLHDKEVKKANKQAEKTMTNAEEADTSNNPNTS